MEFTYNSVSNSRMDRRWKNRRSCPNKKKKEWDEIFREEKTVCKKKDNMWTKRHNASHRVDQYEYTYTRQVFFSSGEVSYWKAEDMVFNSGVIPSYADIAYDDVEWDVSFDVEKNRSCIVVVVKCK